MWQQLRGKCLNNVNSILFISVYVYLYMTACFFCLFLSICLFTSIYLCSSSLSFSFISNKNISIPSVVTRDTFSSITFPSQMTDAARRKAENHCLPIVLFVGIVSHTHKKQSFYYESCN